jgi:hypothetical protein
MELKLNRNARSKGLAVAASLAAMSVASASHAVTLFKVDPNPSGTAVKLDNIKNSTTDSGTVVKTDDVSILVAGKSDFAGGDATIKPSSDVKLTDLIFTPKSDTAFNGFSFRGQDLSKNQTIDVIVTDQSNATQTFMFTVADKSKDFAAFGIIADLANETIKSVEIQNSGGFKEAKQFEFAVVRPVSGVPEPASWAMMLVGFGAAGAAIRRARRVRPVAA